MSKPAANNWLRSRILLLAVGGGILLVLFFESRYHLVERSLLRLSRLSGEQTRASHNIESLQIDKTESYRHAIVFLGNSLIYEGSWSSLLERSDIINGGLPGDRITGIAGRLRSILPSNPAYIVIMGGINDLLQQEEAEEVAQKYCEMIRTLKAAKQSALVCSTLSTRFNSGVNRKVQLLNAAIHACCCENSISYIDLNYLLARNERLKFSYTYDGVHLTAEAYKLWSELIAPHLPPVRTE